MTKTTKPNYSVTLTYGNTKYVDKNMYMTDNENNEVLEDEITRTKEWQKSRKKRVKKFKELGAPEIIVQNEEFLASMTYSEATTYFVQRRIEAEEESKKYREETPIKEEYVNLIYERFDMWFETYKNNEDKLDDELHTGHNFFEPWYWGNLPPGAEKRFYKHILTEDDWHHKNYFPVFEVCNNIIRERFIELGWKYYISPHGDGERYLFSPNEEIPEGWSLIH